jgi:hypothetical protein
MANEYINNKNFESIIQVFQQYKRKKSKYELILRDFEETHNRRFIKYKDDMKRETLESTLDEYKDACLNFKDYQDQLAYAFYLLSENITNYAKFQGIDPDDATQEGVLICFEKVDRFNPNYVGKNGQKAKAFNYMTTCILNHFRQLYRSARNYNELKKRYSSHLADKLETTILFKNGHERYKYKGSENLAYSGRI